MMVKINKTYGKSKSACNIARMLLFLIIGLFNCSPAGSQPVNLKADRPGFSTGTHAVTPGGLYLELGYHYSIGDNYESFSYSQIPDLNLRLGIADKLEMSLMWDGWNIAHGERNDLVNYGNGAEAGLPGLGAKYRLIRSGGYNLTLLGLLEGTNVGNSFSVDPAVALAWDIELSGRFELFGLLQGGSETAGAANYFITQIAIGLGLGISDRLGSFAEYYNVANPGKDEFSGGSEFGVMYLLTPEIQLDIYGGYGPGSEAGYYGGLGIARRF